MTYSIRPEIIARYHEESQRAWADRNAMIAARDEKFRALNREFGCANPDGSFSSSYVGKAGPEYHARYRAIDDQFKPRYEAISSRQEEWRKGLDLTISEYLFLDDFFGPLLEQLCQSRGFGASFRTDLIRRKAEIYIDDWKRKESIGGIYGRIETEIGLFHYAAKRCRSFFGIGALNFGASITIKRYRDEWKQSLYEAINRQRLD